MTFLAAIPILLILVLMLGLRAVAANHVFGYFAETNRILVKDQHTAFENI